MITIDHDSTEAPYAQVREQLRRLIESGELAAGTKLPTVRALAGDLALATNTVARAYRELESLGMIQTRGRAGSVVTGDRVEQASRRAAAEFAEQLRALGLGREDALRLVERAFG